MTGTLQVLRTTPLPPHPDVVVVNALGSSPAQAVRQVLLRDASASVLVAGCPSDATAIADAIRAGARGFVRPVRSGPAPGTHRRTEQRQWSAPVADRLTRREGEVLTAMSQGMTNAEIAAQLQVSVATVKVYAQHVFAKLGTRERAQAVAVGFRDGLLS